MAAAEVLALNGTNHGTPAAATESSEVLNHIVALIETTFGVSRGDLESLGSLLSESKRDESNRLCARFAVDQQIALYARQDRVLQEERNGHDNGVGKSYYPKESHSVS